MELQYACPVCHSLMEPCRPRNYSQAPLQLRRTGDTVMICTNPDCMTASPVSNCRVYGPDQKTLAAGDD